MQLSMGMTQRQAVRQTHRMTQDQKVEQRFAVQVQILQELYGEDYTPRARCPRCNRDLKPQEILEGFLDDPNDFTTQCPNDRCAFRFAPHLVRTFIEGGTAELPFYCSVQVLGMLDKCVGMPWEELEKSQPAMVKSARFHFGTVTNAFSQIGQEYSGEPSLEWWEKVRSFLGKVSDGLIAECAGKSRSMVRRLRRKLGIPPFTGYAE